MTNESLFLEVQTIVEQALGVDCKPESEFVRDLGADSLDKVELIMDFEEKFNIEIPDEDGEKIRTVQDAVNYLAAKVKPRRSA